MIIMAERGPPGPLMPLLMLLSPLGERLGEGVMQETAFDTPSPNLSPKRERNMIHERTWRSALQ
jgi:hypothetical protein